MCITLPLVVVGPIILVWVLLKKDTYISAYETQHPTVLVSYVCLSLYLHYLQPKLILKSYMVVVVINTRVHIGLKQCRLT